MEIQITQVLTHIVAFLIAVWLLKKYAWGPLLGMLEERRNRIAGELDHAASERQEAEGLKGEYEDRLRDIDSQARVRIQQAVTDGQRIAGEIKEKAREDAREMIDKGKQELELVKKAAEVELQQDMVNVALGAAEKVIHERLDEKKHRQLIDEYIRGLERA
jgi:F-type H+-transporting ATPase subunit b